MPVNVNLSRNTKVYYTTNQDITGYGDHNTVEIQVLNGYTFSQGTDQQTIQITEAGATPNRGQRSFNTKLNPVDWKFSTYIRPRYNSTAAANFTVTSAVMTLTTVSNIVTNAIVTATSSSGSPPAVSSYYKITGFTTTATSCNSISPVPVHRSSATVWKWSVPVPANGTAISLTGMTATLTGTATNTAPESCLWNALVSPYDVYSTGVTAGWQMGTASGAAGAAILQSTGSNVHTLAPFALIFKVDNVYYKISGCALNSAEVNFGIDQIAQVSWSGFGTAYTTVSAAGVNELTALTAFDSTAGFLMNKLSVVSIGATIGAAFSSTNGTVTGGTTYNLPITGGSITINNNLSYMTPDVIGVVNRPVGYFSGTKAVSGNLTAYLRTGGTTETSDLLNAIVTGAATASDNVYSMIISMGGQAVVPHIELMFDGAMLQVPSVDVQDVVSTTINFTAQGTSGTAYDINTPNEFKLRYLGA
jgi:hypothetical protein